MKLIDSPNFPKQFPEKYSWSTLDSIKLSRLGELLSAHIMDSLANDPKRNVVPGLRLSLLEIAIMADIGDL